MRCAFVCVCVWLQTRYNEEDERAIVNGAHTNATLQQLVHKYVELFVLCPNCRLPESSEYRVCVRALLVEGWSASYPSPPPTTSRSFLEGCHSDGRG